MLGQVVAEVLRMGRFGLVELADCRARPAQREEPDELEADVLVPHWVRRLRWLLREGLQYESAWQT